ncbi:MAG: hypothetical protein B6D59_03605 [Campylobacteraceae bacterium 4484_4]|nr:MAG: hypothetical protein B6D59_03605 [Campylobacteraceae bacterium 4484_4]
MSKFPSLFSLLIFFSLSLLADGGFKFETGSNSLEGYLKFKEGNGERIDIKKDLKNDESDMILKPSLSFGSQKHRFNFSFEEFKNTSRTELTEDIIYNGALFASQTFVNSSIKMAWAQIQYLYQIHPNFAVGLSIDGIKLDSILSDDGVQQERYTKILILPGINLEGRTTLFEGFDLIGKLSSANAISSGNSFYAYGGIAYKIIDKTKYFCCTDLHLGYQYKRLEIDTDTFEGEFEYSGLYAGIAIRF